MDGLIEPFKDCFASPAVTGGYAIAKEGRTPFPPRLKQSHAMGKDRFAALAMTTAALSMTTASPAVTFG